MERKIDLFGRVVLPKEIREQLEIDENTLLKISVDGQRVILEKLRQDQKEGSPLKATIKKRSA